jgi:hypothetical protein
MKLSVPMAKVPSASVYKKKAFGQGVGSVDIVDSVLVA